MTQRDELCTIYRVWVIVQGQRSRVERKVQGPKVEVEGPKVEVEGPKVQGGKFRCRVSKN